jgi:predicted metal-dependent HD superfamily phosphohydrolase
MSSIDYAGKAERVKQYLLPFFAAHANEHFLYHNLEHTKTVVAAAEQIGNHYQLNPRDLFIVTSAAWFHDSGYFIGKAIEHEQLGALFATSFLESEGLEESVITQIKNCILATKLPQNPTGLLEKIVCDSDLFHLGSDNFAERNRLIRKEAEAISGQKIEKRQWRKSTIALLTNHHYHTDYCQQLLNEKKEANLQQLLSKELEASVDSTVLEQPLSTTLPGTSAKTTLTEIDTPISSIYSGKEPKEKKKVEKKTRPDRGIETMFRLTSNNNQRLSDMADNKAQIMITVNSIILSAIITLLLRKLEADDHLALPTYLTLTVSLLTILFSILATRPKLPLGTFSREDLTNKSVNLLFFGNFYKMDLEDYKSGMWEVMNDREFLYDTLIKDVYSQGVVLGRKYRLLRISYNIFMFGLIASVLSFVFASIIAH